MKKQLLTLLLLLSAWTMQAQSDFFRAYGFTAGFGDLFTVQNTPDNGFASVGVYSDSVTFSDIGVYVKTDNTGVATDIKSVTLGSDYVGFSDMVITTDNGTCIVGSDRDPITLKGKGLIIKMNQAGAVQWSKLLRYGQDCSATKVIKDASGNLFVLGSVTDNANSTEYFLMKLSASGSILQQVFFGTTDTDVPLNLLRAANGDFLVLGFQNDGNGDNIHLIRLNSNMVVQWNKRIVGSEKYFAYGIAERSNGNIVLGGRYDDNLSGFSLLACELTSTGTQVWASSFAPSDYLEAYGLCATLGTNGNFVIAGQNMDTVGTSLAIGVSASGQLLWSKRYGYQLYEYASGDGIAACSDGGYVMCGLHSDDSNSKIALTRVDAQGGVRCNWADWPLTTTSLTLPTNTSVVSSSPGLITLSDTTFSYSSIGHNINICLGFGVNEVANAPVFELFPNPSHGSFSLRFQETEFDASFIRIYNSIGEELKFEHHANGSNTVIDLHAAPGIYLVRAESKGRVYSRPILIN